MDSFTLKVRPQFFAQCFLRHQINCAAKQILKIKLHTKILGRRDLARKVDQYVHITSRLGSIARGRAKQGQLENAKTPFQPRLVLFEQFNGFFAIYSQGVARPGVF